MTLIAPPPGSLSEDGAQLPVPPPAVSDQKEAQALFKEARRRRRQRWLTSVLALMLVTAGVLTYRSTSTTAANGHSTNAKGTASTLAAGLFAGTWHVKYYYVRIADNGRGSVTWPIKTFCGESEQPVGSACDIRNPTTSEVHEGGHAQIRLTSIDGSSAVSVISGSTEPSLLPDGTTLLRYSSSDVLYITPPTPTFSSPFDRSSFCGPRAAALSYAQQTAEHIDCGT
jgi:hypothetical protein